MGKCSNAFLSSGNHLGINIKNTKFVKNLPMIDAQFRFNQCNSYREENISVFSKKFGFLIPIRNPRWLPMQDIVLTQYHIGKSSISAIATEKKIFLYFPIWSCVNTMTCGGGHLGFQIITAGHSFYIGPIGSFYNQVNDAGS
jgi:hypothetical protein